MFFFPEPDALHDGGHSGHDGGAENRDITLRARLDLWRGIAEGGRRAVTNAAANRQNSRLGNKLENVCEREVANVHVLQHDK